LTHVLTRIIIYSRGEG